MHVSPSCYLVQTVFQILWCSWLWNMSYKLKSDVILLKTAMSTFYFLIRIAWLIFLGFLIVFLRWFGLWSFESTILEHFVSALCLLIVLAEFSHRFVHCYFNVLIMGVAGSICKSEYSFVFVFIASLMIILTVIYLTCAFCRCFIPPRVTGVYII